MTRNPTCYPLHPNGWDPVARVTTEVERFSAPAGLPPGIRTGFTGVVHVPWKMHDKGATAMCGRRLLVVRASGEPISCRDCRRRAVLVE